MVIKILSSGQTGVERAALDTALANDIACGGWCPKGRKAEDGPIDPKYALVETELAGPRQSTEANVRDADGTLILSFGNMSKSALQAAAVARRIHKPLCVMDMTKSPAVADVEKWVEHYGIKVLNLAGPSASEHPGGYEISREFLRVLFAGEEGA
jgi:hypothetical protein